MNPIASCNPGEEGTALLWSDLAPFLPGQLLLTTISPIFKARRKERKRYTYTGAATGGANLWSHNKFPHSAAPGQARLPRPRLRRRYSSRSDRDGAGAGGGAEERCEIAPRRLDGTAAAAEDKEAEEDAIVPAWGWWLACCSVRMERGGKDRRGEYGLGGLVVVVVARWC